MQSQSPSKRVGWTRGVVLRYSVHALRSEIDGKRKRTSIVRKLFVGRVKGEYDNMVLANCVFQERDR